MKILRGISKHQTCLLNESATGAEVEVNVKRPNFFLILFILIFAIAGFLAPVIAGIRADNLSPRFLLSIGIFWIVSAYLLKIALWNLGGKEIIVINTDGFIVSTKYWKITKLQFSSDPTKVRLRKMFIRFNTDSQGREIREGRIIYSSGDSEYESSILMSEKDLMEVFNIINNQIQKYKSDN